MTSPDPANPSTYRRGAFIDAVQSGGERSDDLVDPGSENPSEPDPFAATGLAGDGANGGDDADDSPTGEGRSRTIYMLVEWLVVVLGALAVALLVRAFLFQAFYIPSESMEPTLVEHDRVIVNKASYRLHDVNRGDLVVFRRPPNEPPTEIPELIKRVIALPGETIEGRDGVVFVDGRRLIEPYMADGPSFGSFAPVLIPEDHVFVMGDNRNNSRDSRVFGPIDQDLILGRAFVRLWPLSRLGFL